MKKINPDDLNVNPIRQNQESDSNIFLAASNLVDKCQTDPVAGCTTKKEHMCTYTEYTYNCPETFNDDCEWESNNTECICKTYKCPETLTCDPSNSRAEICCAPDTKDACIAKTRVQCASIELCLTSAEVPCESDNCTKDDYGCVVSLMDCKDTDMCVQTINDCVETDMCALSVDVDCSETDGFNCDTMNRDCPSYGICLETNNGLCIESVTCETQDNC